MQKRKREKTLRKCSHLKKINKRHAGNSVQSIQIHIGRRRRRTERKREGEESERARERDREEVRERVRERKCKNTSNRRTVSIFIYANKNHSFRSIPIFFFLFGLVNLNLSSARCQHRSGRDNRVFRVPRPPPLRVIYSKRFSQMCHVFLFSHAKIFPHR